MVMAGFYNGKGGKENSEMGFSYKSKKELD